MVIVFRPHALFVPILFLLISGNPISGATYTYTVDAGAVQGTWSHFYENGVDICHVYTVLNSAYGRNIQNALKIGKNELGFSMFRGHGVLNDDVGLYKEVNGSPVYDWTKFDQIFDYTTSLGMYPIFEFSFMASAIASTGANVCWYNGVPGKSAPPRDYNKWRSIVMEIVKHCETRYGVDVVRNKWLFEVWNEPNLPNFFSGTQNDYFKLYDYAADGIRQADSNCKIGGPAVTGKGLDWLDQFMNHAINGTNLATGAKGAKLDFISYHRYCDDDASNAKSNPDLLVSYHRSVVDVAKKYSFPGKILCDEWAPTWQGVPEHSDLESAGTFVAKTIHMLNDNGTCAAPDFYSWFCLSDVWEEADLRPATGYLSTYGLLLRGTASIPNSWDVPKPIFNVFKMLRMMGNRRLSCTGGSFTQSNNAAATLSADGNAVQILSYDHVNGGLADPNVTNTVNLTVNNIPFAPGNIEVRRYAVDVSHSNSYRPWRNAGSPPQPSSTVWTDMKNKAPLQYKDSLTTVSLSTATFTKTFTQNLYGTELFILSKPGTMVRDPMAAVSGIVNDAPCLRMSGHAVSITMSGTEQHSIDMLDMTGRIAAHFSGCGEKLYIISDAGLSSGVYIARAVIGNKRYSMPFVWRTLHQ